MSYDYAVIGAGAAGMSAAIILARTGAKVVLLEKAPQLAPLLRGFTRHGVHFDTGLHCLGGLADGDVLDVFLRYLGMADKVEKIPFRPEGFDRFRCLEPAWEFDFPYGWDRIADALSAAFPAEEPAVREYLRTIRDHYESLPYINMQAEFDPMQLLPDALGLTLGGFLDRLTDNPRLKTILSFHWLLHGVAPDEAPLASHARVAASYYGAVHGLRGGGRSLVDAFTTQLKAYGVDVFCGSGAARIDFSAAGSVSGVRTESGDGLGCHACIATLHPRHLVDMVPESLFRSAYRTRLKTHEDTCSAFVLYAACDGIPEALQGRNLILAPDSRSVCSPDSAFTRDPPIYVAGTAPDRARQVSPGGFTAICPASPTATSRWADTGTGKRPPDYTAFKEQVTMDICRRLDATCPEIMATVTDMELATPLTIRDYVHTPAGSLYGIKHRMGDHVLAPQTRARGLFLAGQSIVAPGVFGAMLSSVVTCGTILGHERLRKELQA
ncbi:MAG: hypothetical protein A3K19_22765 [Lentisphaerae bacterium RIFOXYB12_FULL_65_16]|nr:MAG: hypothetical protein A3K18_16990 [Lentisphaerae bacterium RIFOXYA12_64_32]OGV90033.1 MAG: hypothetical protein A3K19_22765 [Lentisphaerae bacterium RIFOXYB12_FULL_65_16]